MMHFLLRMDYRTLPFLFLHILFRRITATISIGVSRLGRT